MRKSRSNENIELFKKVLERPKFTIKTVITTTPGHRKSASFRATPTKSTKNVFTSPYSKDYELGNEKAILDSLKSRQNNVVYNFKYGELHKEMPLRTLHKKANSTSNTADANSHVTSTLTKFNQQIEKKDIQRGEELDRFRARVKEFIEPPEGVTALDNYNNLKIYLNKKLADVAALKVDLVNKIGDEKAEQKTEEITRDLRVKNIRKLVQTPVLKRFDLTKSVAELKIDNVLDRIQQAKKDKEKRAQVIREARFETWSAVLNGVKRMNILSQDPNDFDMALLLRGADRSPRIRSHKRIPTGEKSPRSPLDGSPKSIRVKRKLETDFTKLVVSPTMTDGQKIQAARRSPVLNLGSQDRFQKRNQTAHSPRKGRFVFQKESLSSVDSENSQVMERVERIDEITEKFDAYTESFFKQLDALAMYKSEVRVAMRKNTAKARSHLQHGEAHQNNLKIKFRNAIHCILSKLKLLKLTIQEVLTHKVFSTEPFEREGSMEFIKYCKEGQFEKARNMLEMNKYLVYDFDTTRHTALHWSCLRGHSKISKLLLDYGADPDAADISGRTPLFHAAKANSLINVKLLLFNHANPLIKSDGRKTAVDYAEHFDVRDLILKAQKVQYAISMNPLRNQDKIWNSYGKPNYIVRDKELR